MTDKERYDRIEHILVDYGEYFTDNQLATIERYCDRYDCDFDDTLRRIVTEYVDGLNMNKAIDLVLDEMVSGFEESLNEELKLNEQLPPDLARAYWTSGVFNAEQAYKGRRRDIDTQVYKSATNNPAKHLSNFTDYKNATYKQLTPAEAKELIKNDKSELVNIRIIYTPKQRKTEYVKDKAGNITRQEKIVPIDQSYLIAYNEKGSQVFYYVNKTYDPIITNRNGKAVYDSRLIPFNTLCDLADKIYWTNEQSPEMKQSRIDARNKRGGAIDVESTARDQLIQRSHEFSTPGGYKSTEVGIYDKPGYAASILKQQNDTGIHEFEYEVPDGSHWRRTGNKEYAYDNPKYNLDQFAYYMDRYEKKMQDIENKTKADSNYKGSDAYNKDINSANEYKRQANNYYQKAFSPKDKAAKDRYTASEIDLRKNFWKILDLKEQVDKETKNIERYEPEVKKSIAMEAENKRIAEIKFELQKLQAELTKLEDAVKNNDLTNSSNKYYIEWYQNALNSFAEAREKLDDVVDDIEAKKARVKK